MIFENMYLCCLEFDNIITNNKNSYQNDFFGTKMSKSMFQKLQAGLILFIYRIGYGYIKNEIQKQLNQLSIYRPLSPKEFKKLERTVKRIHEKDKVKCVIFMVLGPVFGGIILSQDSTNFLGWILVIWGVSSGLYLKSLREDEQSEKETIIQELKLKIEKLEKKIDSED